MLKPLFWFFIFKIILLNNILLNSVNIYDLSGRKIISKVFTNTDYQLDISSLSAANYFVFIYSDTGEVVKRLIKN